MSDESVIVHNLTYVIKDVNNNSRKRVIARKIEPINVHL